MSTKIEMKAKTVKALPIPEKGHVEYQDTEEKHLFLRVSKTGRKSWNYRATWGQKMRREALGPFPQISVSAARYTVKEIDLEWESGAAAARVRQKMRRTGIVTVGDLWEVYMAAVEDQLRPKTLAEKRSLWKLYLSNVKNELLDSLNSEDIQMLHDSIAEDGKLVTANRALKVLRACMRWAVERGYIPADPTAGVKKFRENSRERFLKPSEKDAFFRELGKAPVDLRHYVILSIATGARQRNVLAMRWDQVDLERRTWEIDRPESKTEEPLVIPLVQAAVEVLKERRERIQGEWVFPSRAKSSKPYIQSMKTSWDSVRTEAGCHDLRMHDLRRTLGSWMAMSNVSGAIIGRALGHQDPASTAIYARLMTDPVAAAMDQAATSILTDTANNDDKRR